MLVDHHCHLDFPQFGPDRSAVVERARAAGVGILVTISTRIRRLPELLALAEPFPNVFCSVGTHPHHADTELDVTVEEIVRLSQHPKVVAIGEAGLDYFYQKSPKQAQEEGFRRHIEAARITGLPLEIHTRDADEDTIRILEDEHAKGPFPAILRSPAGALARRAVSSALRLVHRRHTFKKSEACGESRRQSARPAAGRDRRPYLAPEPIAQDNEPAMSPSLPARWPR
jgi:TatD DNase family protein